MTKILVIGGCGYVGSKLVPALIEQCGHDVDSIDILKRGNPYGINNIECNALTLTTEILRPYQEIILLAGHSSVGACITDPKGAIENNILLFQHILDEMDQDSRLIYASSGSVYDGARSHLASESSQLTPSRNMYDLTKVTVDEIAELSERDTLGMRFGTVVGPSPNIREELLINAMVKDALTQEEIRLANPTAFRAILGINDLISAVISILEVSSLTSGVINIASFNSNMKTVAESVAKVTGVTIRELPSTPTYDFSMSIEKLKLMTGWSPVESIESISFDLSKFYGDVT